MSIRGCPVLICRYSGGSVAGALAAVDVQDLAGDERGGLEVENAGHHVADLAEAPHGMQLREGREGFRWVQRRLDNAKRDGVCPDTPRRVLDRQRHGVRVLDHRGGYVHDVPAAAL